MSPRGTLVGLLRAGIASVCLHTQFLNVDSGHGAQVLMLVRQVLC